MAGAAGDSGVRKATPADIPVLVPRLARAFQPQPLARWVAGDDDRALARVERLIALDFDRARAYDLIFTTADLAGAALWHPPGVPLLSRGTLAWAWRLACLMGIGGRLGAQVAFGLSVLRAEPRTRHYYLATLGVAPEWQGRGIGSALLRPVLARCDTEYVPAYLLTDTEPNVRFYARHGFDIRHELLVRGARVRVWGLWREPGAHAGPAA